MEQNKNKIEYCDCKDAGLINDGGGVDINCHYCGKEVDGMRVNFEKTPDYEKYTEYENGRFTLKNGA